MKGECLNKEADILRRLKKGEEAALRELIGLYRTKMLMEAYYVLRDMDEAEDIVQEIFIRFWNVREQVELKPSLVAYLLRATRNESIIKQKKKKVANRKQNAYNYSIDTSTHMKPFEAAELAKQLEDAMEYIPPAARKSFIKLYLEDKSQKTIAAEQNISLQVVKNNISKALRILREKLHVVKLL